VLPLLPIGVALLGGGTWFVVSKRKKAAGMTAERKLIFDQLLNSAQDPALVREMADVFEKHGLKDQAELLRKRAKLSELPQAKKDEYKQIFRDAMADKDPKAVEAVATAFEKQGATGNAQALRTYAQSLRTAQAAAPKAPGPGSAPPATPPAENVKPPEHT
jgi:hypothetical protein